MVRVASHSDIGVIELMPTSDGQHYGFKYVNGHPGNMRQGLQTVTAFGVLADVATGYPLLLSEMTILTALRTAATSAMAARWLAPHDSRVMAMIGNGAQAEFQALAFMSQLGIRELRVYDALPPVGQQGREAEEVAADSGLTIALTVHILMDLSQRGLVERDRRRWSRAEQPAVGGE